VDRRTDPQRHARVLGAADRAAFTLHTLRGAGLDVAGIHALLLDES
jgi:hypothetical protein